MIQPYEWNTVNDKVTIIISSKLKENVLGLGFYTRDLSARFLPRIKTWGTLVEGKYPHINN